MDGETRSALRLLELQNEAKSQEISIAYQTIANLESRVAELSGPETEFVANASNEGQIDFIRKVAESRTKFAKEAQSIIDAIESSATVEEPSDNGESDS